MRTSKLINLVAQSVLVCALISVATGKIIYVDADANGLNDGSSWANAYKYLQDALADANSSAKPVETRVAQGIYRPDEDTRHPDGTGDREATFQLKNGVAIKGGYAGFGEANPDARDVRAHVSVLSGDLSKTLPVLTKENFEEVLYNRVVQDYRNSYHVVTGSGTDATAVLDGFVITGGTANGPAFGEPAEQKYFCGGGVYVESGSPTLVDCVIRGNVAFVYGGPPAKGGGMFDMNSSPVLTRCSFIMNWADDMDSDAYGAGMMNQDSSPILLNCIFENNLTWNWGGGMYNIGVGSVTLIGCKFFGNWGQYGGGAIYNELYSDDVLTTSNCLFAGNSAGQPGGAVDMHGGSYILDNCTFTGNRTSYYEGGNAIAFYYYHLLNRLEAVNCIFRDGGDEVLYYDRSVIQISFSNIQGGWPGQGNIDVDPCFAQAGYWDLNGTPDNFHDDFWINGDYHLKSQAGRWDANEERWTKDEVTSLCIDAGDPASPIGLEPFPNGGIINMGAYGGTVEASKSYFGEPTCETIVAGDINGDCIVNLKDFAFIACHWLEEY